MDPPPPPKVADPLWAKICLIAGAIVAIVSGAVVVVPKVVAAWATANIPQENLIPPEIAGDNIDGPINFLLLGMDERIGEEDLIRADTIIIVHIPASHDAIYMVSLPRDSQVAIPDYPKSDFIGFRTKINAAFAYGARTDGRVDPSTEGRRRGAELTMLTINNLVPGGLRFNGAAIINFDGFIKVLEAIDGVDMCVDQETRSQHYDKNGVFRDYKNAPYDMQKVYPVGCYHMAPWEALDFSRQRDFPNGDYTRQRHQQQLLMAILKKVTSRGVLTDLGKVVDLQKSAGDLLTLDLGAAAPEDWFITLRSLRADDVVMIKTNGGKTYPLPGGDEQLTEDTMGLLKAVHDDTIFDFLARHPDWIASSPTQPGAQASTAPAGQ
jgi:anionic cell wall polymer biosynthesis LytR-Cps2A-Psr (LCP) family protein